MYRSRFRSVVIAFVSVAILNTGAMQAAQGAIVETGAMVQSARDADLAAVQSQLAREEVRAQLERYGVGPETVDARLATLSDSELAKLAKRMKDAPAGKGVVALVGAVFIVLLILELVGVIDIFKRT